MKSDDTDRKWIESIRLEEEKQKLSSEFELRRSEIMNEVDMARERLDEMASNTVKKVEAELPGKLEQIAITQEKLYVEALAEIDRLKNSLDELSLDAVAERSFLVLSGLHVDEEGRR
nr:hypothetical protein [uncultured Dethiosulfovibrio sp.]